MAKKKPGFVLVRDASLVAEWRRQGPQSKLKVPLAMDDKGKVMEFTHKFNLSNSADVKALAQSKALRQSDQVVEVEEFRLVTNNKGERVCTEEDLKKWKEERESARQPA